MTNVIESEFLDTITCAPPLINFTKMYKIQSAQNTRAQYAQYTQNTVTTKYIFLG